MSYTPADGLALLMLLTALDNRHQTGDEMSTRGKAETWARVLGDADPEWVRRFVERAYSDPRPYPLSVGDIRRGWDNHKRVQVAKDTTPDVSLPGLPRGVWAKRPPWFDQYRRDCDAVRAQGGDPAGVPLPFTPMRFDDSRERRCVNWETCACTHTECRRGFLDEETPEGRVRRCHLCVEAAEMKQELAPPRRRTGARR